MTSPPAPEAQAPATGSFRSELAILVGFVLLAAFQSGIHSNLTTHLYGGGRGDICIDTWVLSRVTHNLLTTPWQPFEGNIYYPSYSSVLYTDPILGPAVLVLPLRLVGASPVLLYNIAVLLSLAVASFGFYRLARQLGAVRGAALLAGVVIPFSSRQTAHLFHLNLLSLAFFPFFIGGLLRLLERPSWRAASVTGVSFALQSGTSGYHAFSAALIAIVALAWSGRRLRDWRLWAGAGLAVAIAAVLLYPYLSGFAWIGAHEADLIRDSELPPTMSMDLMGFLGSISYVWRDVLPGRGPYFPGLAVLAFAAWALRGLRRNCYVSLLLLLALAAYALALGPDVRLKGEILGPGPFRLLHQNVPFMASLRHPYSFAAPGLIALGLLASLGLSKTWLGRSRVGLPLMLALATAETIAPHPSRSEARMPLPSVYEFLKAQPPGALLEVPMDDDPWLWWAAWHELRIVNGVGAFEPARYQALWQLFRKDWKQRPPDMEGTRWLEHLKAWYPIRYVVVHASAEASLRRAVAATSTSLRRIHETPEGDRVYVLARGGKAPRLKRAFRDDQLREGVLTVRLRGTLGLALFNDEPLPPAIEQPGDPAQLRWDGLRSRLRRGLNVLELRAVSESTELELIDVDAR